MNNEEKDCFCLASAELKQEAINGYCTCLVDVKDKTAQQAFSSTCKFYGPSDSDIPEWRVPKAVAMILNPGLRL